MKTKWYLIKNCYYRLDSEPITKSSTENLRMQTLKHDLNPSFIFSSVNMMNSVVSKMVQILWDHFLFYPNLASLTSSTMSYNKAWPSDTLEERSQTLSRSYKILIVQSSAIRTLGLRIVRTDEIFPPRSRTGPSSISTFWLAGSTWAALGSGDRPNRIILSTVHAEVNLLLPGSAIFVEVSSPLENVKRRCMWAPFWNSKLFPSST